jgi:hypothetical protein
LARCRGSVTGAMKCVLTALLGSVAHAATTVVTYPDPKAAFVDNTFQVQVQAADAPAGSAWLHAPTYTSYAPVDGPVAQRNKTASFVQISTDGPIKVRCTRLGGPWDDDALVRPVALGINTASRPNYTTLELAVPASPNSSAYQFSVEDPEELQDALLVFVNPLETNIPSAQHDDNSKCARSSKLGRSRSSASAAPCVHVVAPGDHRGAAGMRVLGGTDVANGTVVFSAGVHYITPQTQIADNTRVYLAGGAVVFGSFTTSSSATNVTVDGRGILSGHAIPGGGGPTANDTLTLVNLCGAGMTVSGIAAVDAPSYLCVPRLFPCFVSDLHARSLPC